MNAYYYGFGKTGVLAIDKILSAVACAGKAFHHTDAWNDECKAYHPGHTGNSPVEWIQNAANEAAAALTLTWSEEKPKEPGWWWVRDKAGDEPIIVFIYENDDDELWCMTMGGPHGHLELFSGEWAGPLVLPREE